MAATPSAAPQDTQGNTLIGRVYIDRRWPANHWRIARIDGHAVELCHVEHGASLMWPLGSLAEKFAEAS